MITRTPLALFTLACVCVAATALAAPAKPTVARAIKDAKFTKKVDCKQTSAERTASQTALFMNTRTKEVISKREQWLTLDIECRLFDPIPGYPKAYRKFDGRMTYQRIDGPWKFYDWKEWDVWLEGMPPPDPAVVNAGLADRLKILDWNFLTRTTAIHRYGVREGSPVLWSDVTKLKVDVEAEVEAWDGADLVRQVVVVPVHFYKLDNGTWDPRPGSQSTIKEISRRTPSEDERKAMESVIVSERKRAAAAKLAALPAVDIPAFASATEGMAFVYEKLHTASAAELESVIRRLADELTEEQIMAAVAGQGAFKEQYCREPAPKHERSGFANKDDSSWTEIRFVPSPSTEFKDGKPVSKGFRLSSLSLGLVKGDELAALKSYSYDLCGAVLPKASGHGFWKVGDPVQIAYTRSWEPGEIVRIAARQIYVHDKTSNTTSVLPLSQIREPQAEAKLPFEIGDRVEGNYGGGGRWFKGTLKSFNTNKDKALIRYDDGTSEYLKLEHIRKL